MSMKIVIFYTLACTSGT